MIHDLFFEVAADDNIGTCILIISNHADTAWAEANHLSLHFFKKWAILGLFFLYFRLFNTVDIKVMARF